METLFWPPKKFHKLTEPWDFVPLFLSGWLFSHDIKLSETVRLQLLSPPWGKGDDGFTRAFCICPQPSTGKTQDSWSDQGPCMPRMVLVMPAVQRH